MNNVVFWAVKQLKRTFQKLGNKHCAHSANQTSQQLRCFSWEVTDPPHNGPNLTSSDFQFFLDLLKELLTGKQFATHADTKHSTHHLLPRHSHQFSPHWDTCLDAMEGHP